MAVLLVREKWNIIKDKKCKLIKFDLNLIVNGNGSSLWSDDSKGKWKITSGTLQGCALNDKDFPGGIWELQLFGPKTQWDHYTDEQIEKGVNSQLKSLVAEKIGYKVKKIGWSEQGMQPDGGWSFDVLLTKSKV